MNLNRVRANSLQNAVRLLRWLIWLAAFVAVMQSAESATASAQAMTGQAAAPPAATPQASSSGFHALFNARNLNGWHTSRTTHHGTVGNFRVEDSAIVLRQFPIGQGGLLLTDKKYKDFELTLEANPDWGTNSGIFFRSSEGGTAYQIELVGGGIGGTGNLLGEVQRVTTQALAKEAERVWRPGEWNRIRLRVIGDKPRVTLWINDSLMYDVQAERNDLIADRTEGMIGLQAHWTAVYGPTEGSFDLSGSWRAGAAQRYRRIFIKEFK